MPTSLGPAEILVILVVALIVLGPKRLPEAGRQVGKAIAEVRKWSQGFQDEIRSTMEPETRPSYTQPQPGYDPPLPVASTEVPAIDVESLPATTNWADEPTYSDPAPLDPAPLDPAGPPAGEPPHL